MGNRGCFFKDLSGLVTHASSQRNIIPELHHGAEPIDFVQASARPTAAAPVEDPHCSCELTRVRPIDFVQRLPKEGESWLTAAVLM